MISGNEMKSIISLVLIWIVEPLLNFVALNIDVVSVSEFLITFKDLINVITSLIIVAITILKYKKMKK